MDVSRRFPTRTLKASETNLYGNRGDFERQSPKMPGLPKPPKLLSESGFTGSGDTGRCGGLAHPSDRGELVAELFLFRLEVSPREGGRRDFEGNPFRHRELIALDTDELPRVVRQEAHRTDPEIAQNLDADAVVALIRLEAQALVRLHRIEALILELVGANLVRQPDAASLLVQIEEHTAAFFGDPLHGRLELKAAVATRRVKDIAGEATRVDAHQHVVAAADIPFHQRD